jgi:beta-N-acetylhexosaminidase
MAQSYAEAPAARRLDTPIGPDLASFGEVQATNRLMTRRRFLGGAAATAAALLAACAAPELVTPSPVSTQTPTPTATARPTATAIEPDLRTKIGQMLLVGFRGTTAEESASVVADIRERGLGGVVLFSVDQPTGSTTRNIESSAQLAALTAVLQQAALDASPGLPLLIAVDEEGGRVARLGPDHGFPATESAAALGARNDAGYTRAAAAGMAATLVAVGVNLNLAPVVDLNVNPQNPIIGALDRSFSADPAVVVSQAAAFVAGHHDLEVRTTLKHFPGHGSSTGDTHAGVVDVTATWSERELTPFADLIADGLADAVLTAHVFNASLDAAHPATLSRATITGILRDRLGFDGPVLSDDMQMGAIREAYGYEDAIQLAINAGVDVLTLANQQLFEEGIVGRTIDLIASQVADGTISEARIDESWRRIQAFKASLGSRV